MTITAQSIIRRCVDTLQDSTSVRWPVPELVRYLNDGQRELVLHRPDACIKHTTLALASGSRQDLPGDGAKLIEVVRNVSGRAVRLVNREILDAQMPGWHSQPGSATVLHFMFDTREPTVFYVYPPASGASLDIVYAAYPDDVAEPADGSTYTAVVGNIGLPDMYANVLQDYILYRAYSKDSEYAGNAQRAQMHYAAFSGALAKEAASTMAMAPVSPGNPNAPTMQRAAQ